jgi:hypothetical protein
LTWLIARNTSEKEYITEKTELKLWILPAIRFSMLQITTIKVTSTGNSHLPFLNPSHCLNCQNHSKHSTRLRILVLIALLIFDFISSVLVISLHNAAIVIIIKG